jgi:hypothetical protein
VNGNPIHDDRVEQSARDGEPEYPLSDKREGGPDNQRERRYSINGTQTKA